MKLKLSKDRWRKRQKKAIGLIHKTTTLHVHHVFLYISLPFLYDFGLKMPNLKFHRGRKQAHDEVLFPLLNLDIFLRNLTPGGFTYIWQSKWVAGYIGIVAIKIERTQVHFLSDVFAAVTSSDLKVPISCRKRISSPWGQRCKKIKTIHTCIVLSKYTYHVIFITRTQTDRYMDIRHRMLCLSDI